MATTMAITSPSILFLSLPILLLISTSTTFSSPVCNPSDKTALLAIGASLKIKASRYRGWTPATDCCNWVGVVCDDTTGRVTALNVYPLHVSATIPSAIGDLPFLTHVDIRQQSNLTGPIPPAISRLTRLTWLRLDKNSLTGPVPTFLFRLPVLNYLDLSHNRLTGGIPPAIASSSLNYLFLSRNSLSGPISSYVAKSNVTTLFLDHNHFTGPLPLSFAHSVVEDLDFSSNRLTGDPSLLFGAKSPRGIVSLSRNLFEFNLSAVVLPKGLAVLNLDHNRVYGSIPPMITKLDELQVLNVSYNLLCGKIPPGGKLGKFFAYNPYNFFHNKCLCGPPLPACK